MARDTFGGIDLAVRRAAAVDHLDPAVLVEVIGGAGVAHTFLLEFVWELGDFVPDAHIAGHRERFDRLQWLGSVSSQCRPGAEARQSERGARGKERWLGKHGNLL